MTYQPIENCKVDDCHKREYLAEIERLRAALEAVAGFGSVNLTSEWEHSLRDIIRSMTYCASNALNSAEQSAGK